MWRCRVLGVVFLLCVAAQASFSAGGKVPQELREALAAEEPLQRRGAVKKLAVLGTRDAWKLVIEALGDPAPEPADEAQYQLALLDDAKLIESLYGRAGLAAKQPLVRRRAAECFGRMGAGADGVELAGKLSRREPDLSRTLLWSIERLATAGRLHGDPARVRRVLEKTVRMRGDGRVRAAALCALDALIGDEVAPWVGKALGDRDPLLVCGALTLCGRLGEEAALACCRELAGSPHPEVRSQVLETLYRLGSRGALLALVERLDAEERLRLRHRCVELLQRLSGMRYRVDPRPWRLWASKLPDDWRSTWDASPAPRTGGSVAFAGLPVLSDRVCFLVDFSGSLWHRREDGTTKKEVVDAHVEGLFPALPEGTEFNVIPYTREPFPWRERLVPTSERTAAEGVGFFRACRERGQGNFYDAALLALSDPRVDTVVVLTDGAPTGGQRWKLELMMPLLAQEVRFRRVAFDSILVDAPRRLHRHWAWLAAATGGRSLAVELTAGAKKSR